MKNRIVITGIEVITPLGLNLDKTWENMENGKSGFSKIESFKIKNLNTTIGAEIKKFVNKKDKWLELFFLLIKNSLINQSLDKKILSESSLSIGSSFMGIETDHFKNKLDRYIKIIKDKYGFSKGISFNTNTCAAGNFCIFNGANQIKHGFTKTAVCIGIDVLSPYLFNGFDSIRSLSKDEPKPFSLSRDGMALGEGGGIMILENHEHALKRNTKISCEYLGFGATCDNTGVNSMDKTGEGIIKCFENALLSGRIKKKEVDLISTHGTGTKLNDSVEAKAISIFFKNMPYIQAFKSYFGHSMGASSMIEACILAETLKKNRLIKIRNLNSTEFKLNFVKKNLKKTINIGINNAFGFGGINSCVVFKKYQQINNK